MSLKNVGSDRSYSHREQVDINMSVKRGHCFKSEETFQATRENTEVTSLQEEKKKLYNRKNIHKSNSYLKTYIQ